ncbi:MAG: glycoside hydrolase family 99-like domain-containing protein [Acidimicrobiales bacterium]
MSSPGAHADPRSPVPRALAFYLPQFHPIPENDTWWGPGFTEWLNVTRARPLYPGHYQPHVPGELGYYDLRVPEVREAQAELARSHGISGFVYYHYWFQGKQLLNRPFDEVLASGSPDFPFALCWANEEWTRNWDGRSGTVLMPQTYSDKDDLDHIRWLCEAFADRRYITIDGRPMMLIYRPAQLPDPRRTTDRWREEAQGLGLPDLYLCWVDGFGRPEGGPERYGFDATVGFVPFSGQQLFAPVESLRTHRVLDYESAAASRLSEPPPSWKHFPSVMVGWDSTARHPGSATIFENATPAAFRNWLERTVASVDHVRPEENYVFLVAWNEWAEGNHLEPDQRYGRAFLEAARSVLMGAADGSSRHVVDGTHSDRRGRDPTALHVSELLRQFGIALDGRSVALCVRGHRDRSTLLDGTTGIRVLDHDIDSVQELRSAGTDANHCDLVDAAALADSLDSQGELTTVIVFDALERLVDPQRLLTGLSAWSLARGGLPVVVVVPNVAHFDRGLRLLAGEWGEAGAQPSADLDLHYFTEAMLERMLERCGWSLIARDDVCSVESSQYDPALNDSLPREMVGALRVFSEHYNPQWAIERFVWLLTPVPVDAPPISFDDAVGRTGVSARAYSEEQRRAVERYLSSVGLLASETNRRAATALPSQPPGWKRAILRTVNRTPRSASAYQRLTRRIG